MEKQNNISKINNIPEKFLPLLNVIQEAFGIDHTIFMNVSLLNGDKSCTVYLYNQKALTLTVSTKVSYIVCIDAASITHQTDSEIAYSIINNVKDFRFEWNLEFDKEAFIFIVHKIADYLRSSVTVQRFGCCNRFIQCSDARRCLYFDCFDALGCYYRENLESGRIFYGKNRNYYPD